MGTFILTPFRMTGPSTKFPNVEKFDSTGKGRGLRSKKCFRPGNVIMKCDPFAYVIHDEMAPNVCQYTLDLAIAKAAGQEAPVFMKCGNCKTARYSSRDAQKKDWKDHKDECKAMCRVAPKKFNNETRLVAKMLSKLNRLNGKASPEEELITVMEMQDHIEKRDAENRVSIDENVMNFGDYYGYENLPQDDDYTLNHLFGLLECNGFSITDSRGITMVGVGVYPSISLLNHSLAPNCVAVSIGKTVHLRALIDIPEGEELFINYLDELTPMDDAIDMLKTQYYFDYNVEDEWDVASIPKIKAKNDLLVGYHKGEAEPKQKQIDYITKYSAQMTKKMEKTMRDGNHQRYTLQATGALMQQEHALPDTNLMKIKVLRIAVDGMCAQHSYKEALEYAERVQEAYKELLPKHSATLAMYNLKVGTIKWHLQEIEDAIKTLADAAHGLEITHGETHNMYQDCTTMIMQCQQESVLDKFSRAKIRAAREQMGQNVAIDINEALKDTDGVAGNKTK